jgi:hypothetical protein
MALTECEKMIMKCEQVRTRKVEFVPVVNISPFVRNSFEYLRKTLSVEFELRKAR